jgi:hypothetical protein
MAHATDDLSPAPQEVSAIALAATCSHADRETVLKSLRGLLKLTLTP